jgi:hypothetical protein
MQWRKLFDLNPLFAVLSDKYAARDFIGERIGPRYLPELLWVGEDPQQAPLETLPLPYVVKSTHAAGHSVRVRDRSELDAAGLRARMTEWLQFCHGSALCEPGYVPVPRRIVVEKLLTEPDGSPPTERSLFVFHGRVRMIQTRAIVNGNVRSAAFHDLDWRPIDFYLVTPPGPHPLPRPARLDEMIGIAERLGADLDHLRVDLYDCADGLRVGELTLYSWSGHHATNPRSADYSIGSQWTIKRPLWRAIRTVATRPYAITRN